MNVVSLLGRVGRDPELKYSQSSMAICNCFMATSKKIKGEDKTQWHRLVAFGKTAELIEKYVSKGDQLAIEGEISYGSYEKDGNPVYTTDIIVNRIHFVGGKSKQDQERNPASNQGYRNNQQPMQHGNQEPMSDGDVLF